MRSNTIYMWEPKSALRRLLYSAIYLLIIGAICNACNDFTDVDVPNNQLLSNGVFEEKATANAAMTDIYSKIRDAGMLNGGQGGLSFVLGNYTDELKFYGPAENSSTKYYNNSLVASQTEIKNLWTVSYNQIYAANAVIDGCAKSIKLLQADRDQLTGEALFVRALIHFYLTDVFGGVPYVLTTDYQINRNVSRNTPSEVYAKAKEDLDKAIALLPENYITEGRSRPNKFAAYALLARVNLYAGLWDEASNAASAVMNNDGLYTYVDTIEAEFLKGSKSTIWQLSPKSDSGNTNEAATFIFTGGPPPLSAISGNLYNAFEAGDLRQSHWIKAVTNGTDTWYHAFKYKVKGNSGNVENSVILRLGELYLVRAEARAHSGDLIGAKEDLNKIRHKAGLGDTPALSQGDILSAILNERRFELFTEMGHRFFDLKRFGVINPTLSAVKTGWDANDVLFPLPDSEISLNPNLAPQNPGY